MWEREGGEGERERRDVKGRKEGIKMEGKRKERRRKERWDKTREEINNEFGL